MRNVQHVIIGSGQSVSSFVSIGHAEQVAVFAGVFTANATSTMVFSIHAANVPLGTSPTSALFLPVRTDAGSLWSFTTAGSFAVALDRNLMGFDVIRFAVSSVLATTASMMVISKV